MSLREPSSGTLLAPDLATESLLPPAILAQIKNLELKARRQISDATSGNYRSTFRGRGMDFDRVREYQPGDDVRQIDWNVTARMRSPYVKEHREERQLTVMILCDISGSTDFASHGPTRRERAVEIVAALATIAAQSQDRVGLILFTDRIERVILPKRGRGHVWRLIRDTLCAVPEGRKTDVGCALEELGRAFSGRTVSFLVSDFLDPNLYGPTLTRAGRTHDMTAIWLRDRRETELLNVGLLEVEHAETKARHIVDTSSANARALFAEAAVARDRRIERDLGRAGCQLLSIQAEEETAPALARHLRGSRRRAVR